MVMIDNCDKSLQLQGTHLLFSSMYRPKCPSLLHQTQQTLQPTRFLLLIISRSQKYSTSLVYCKDSSHSKQYPETRLEKKELCCCVPPRTRHLVSWTTTRLEQRERCSLWSFHSSRIPPDFTHYPGS